MKAPYKVKWMTREQMLSEIDTFVGGYETVVDPHLFNAVTIKRNPAGHLWLSKEFLEHLDTPQSTEDVLTRMFEEQFLEEERAKLSAFNPATKEEYNAITEKLKPAVYEHTALVHLDDATVERVHDYLVDNKKTLFAERIDFFDNYIHKDGGALKLFETITFDTLITRCGKPVKEADITIHDRIDYDAPYSDYGVLYLDDMRMKEPTEDKKANIRVTVEVHGFYKIGNDYEDEGPEDYEDYKNMDFGIKWEIEHDRFNVWGNDPTRFEFISVTKVEDINQEHFKEEDFYDEDRDGDVDIEDEDCEDGIYSDLYVPADNPFHKFN